jgi:hypothetical protein
LVGALGLVIIILAAPATFPFQGKHRLPLNRDRRFDERDVVFSRARLQSGTKEFKNRCDLKT